MPWLNLNHFGIFAGHSDKPADWQEADGISRFIFLKRKDFWSESDCKFTAEDACTFGENQVPKFMEEYQGAKNDDKGNNCIQIY